MEIIANRLMVSFLALGLLSASCAIWQGTALADGYDAQLEGFEIEDWGLFWTVDYLGEQYFAVYEKGLLYDASKDADLTKDKQLSRVFYNDFYNSHDYITLSTGTSLRLKEGYELAIKAVDLDGDKIFLMLHKDGAGVDSAIINFATATDVKTKSRTIEDETYTYSVKIGDKNVGIIAVHFKNAFRGAWRDLTTVDRVWQVLEDQPSRVLYDSDEERIFASGTPLELEEGYELDIMAIDLEGDKVYVELYKDGKTVDSAIVEPPDTAEGYENYTYSVNKDTGDVEIISIRFKNIFRGAEQDLATVNRIWQASEDLPSRVCYDSVDENIISLCEPLKLEDGYELVLEETDLMGEKAYVELYKNGTVVDSAVVVSPNALVGDETYIYSVDTNGDKDVEIISVHFKNAFRGPERDVATVDQIWQASEDLPSRLLYDSVDETVITPLESLKLVEGYELAIAAIDLEGNKVLVELYKDGTVVDSAVITPPKTTAEGGSYTYSVDMDGTEDVEIISVHFKNAFRDPEQDLATVDLIWQMSEDQPSRLLYGSADETVITSGMLLELKNGYELAIEEIDLEGNKVYVELYKDGAIVDSAVVVPPEATIEDKTYTYATDLGNTEDIVIIAVHFKNAFRGAEQDLATVDGIWQISETPIVIG